MGSAAEVPVVISSDEDDAQAPAAGKRKSPDAAALAWAEGILDQEDYDDAVLEGVGCPAKMLEIFDSLRAETGIVVGDEGVVAVKNTTMPDARGDDDDDDDCVMLDGDPDKPVAVAKEEGRTPRDAAEDELQIVAEKGEVNDRTIEMAYALCENKHAKSLQDMEDISGVMKKVSDINFDDWDSLKRVFVVKIIICYPEETENSKMFSDNELSKLLSIAPSLEGKLFIKNTCMEIYEDIVFARAVRVKSVED